MVIKKVFSRIGKNDFFASLIQKNYWLRHTNPEIIEVHTSTKCNFDCVYCYASKEDAHLVDWKRIIIQAAKLKVKQINFLGGEPLLDEHIETYLDMCEKYGMKTMIFTNGVLLDKHLLAFLKKLKRTKLVIKFDELDSYERYTAKNQYENVIAAIHNCKKNAIPVSLHVVITKQNVNHLNSILATSEHLNLVSSFERYMPSEHASLLNKELELNTSEWNQALSKLHAYYQKKDSHYDFASIIKGSTCSCYLDRLSIDVKGNVKPCPLASDDQIVGNVQSQSLGEIWYTYKKQREKWMKIPDDCLSCRYKYLCHGGCKTNTFLKYRTYNKKDPLCNGTFNPTLGVCGFDVKPKS